MSEQTPSERDNRITTFSGLLVNPFNLWPDDIDIEDIAHALSMKCRWGGMTREFYSVAEHSVRLINRVPKGFEMAALMHDAMEAYIGDICSPLKRQMAVVRNDSVVSIKEIEEIGLNMIWEKFGIPWDHYAEVMQADKEIRDYEAAWLMHTNTPVMAPVYTQQPGPPLDWRWAKTQFKGAFSRYFQGER